MKALPATRRRRLHRQVGEASTAAREPDPDAVAYHFEQARDTRRAAWLVAAGDRADRLGAYVTAADRHERALALLGDRDATLRGWLLVRLGMLLRVTDLGRALGYLEAAESAVRSSGDPALVAYWQASGGMVRCLAGRGRTGLPDLGAGVRGIRALPEDARSAGSLPACRPRRAGDGRRIDLCRLAGHAGASGGRSRATAKHSSPSRWAGEGQARPAGDVNFGLALAYAGLGHPHAASEAATRARDAYRQIGNHGMAIMITRLLVRFILLPYHAVVGRSSERHCARRTMRWPVTWRGWLMAAPCRPKSPT